MRMADHAKRVEAHQIGLDPSAYSIDSAIFISLGRSLP